MSGRTARQSAKGMYQLMLNEEETVKRFKILKSDKENKEKSEYYQLYKKGQISVYGKDAYKYLSEIRDKFQANRHKTI